MAKVQGIDFADFLEREYSMGKVAQAMTRYLTQSLLVRVDRVEERSRFLVEAVKQTNTRVEEASKSIEKAEKQTNAQRCDQIDPDFGLFADKMEAFEKKLEEMRAYVDDAIKE